MLSTFCFLSWSLLVLGQSESNCEVSLQIYDNSTTCAFFIRDHPAFSLSFLQDNYCVCKSLDSLLPYKEIYCAPNPQKPLTKSCKPTTTSTITPTATSTLEASSSGGAINFLVVILIFLCIVCCLGILFGLRKLCLLQFKHKKSISASHFLNNNDHLYQHSNISESNTVTRSVYAVGHGPKESSPIAGVMGNNSLDFDHGNGNQNLATSFDKIPSTNAKLYSLGNLSYIDEPPSDEMKPIHGSSTDQNINITSDYETASSHNQVYNESFNANHAQNQNYNPVPVTFNDNNENSYSSIQRNYSTRLNPTINRDMGIALNRSLEEGSYGHETSRNEGLYENTNSAELESFLTASEQENKATKNLNDLGYIPRKEKQFGNTSNFSFERGQSTGLFKLHQPQKFTGNNPRN
ncbi:hypothetical protein BC833DRAFT_620054 [Globomyces pollinis-pini]|nr:hypothetical protein BC833DRAFT_620054 [Globomyces pollinis-pini]